MFFLYTACTDLPLKPFDDLTWFADVTGEPCSLSPTVALGNNYRSWRIGAVAADADHVYAVFTEATRTRLTVVDALTTRAVGELEIEGLSWASTAHRAGDWLFIGSGNRQPKVHVVDVSDPALPALLGKVDLGNGDQPSSFAQWGDRVYTDGGTTLYLDLVDPYAPVAVPAAPNERLRSPVLIGDELLANRTIGPTCLLQVLDPAGPTVLATLDTADVCLDLGLVPLADGQVVGFGSYATDGSTVAQRFTREDDGWNGSETLHVPVGDVSQATSLGPDAMVLGTGGPLETYGGVIVRGDPFAVQETWWPDTYYRSNLWFNGAAGTGGTPWVAVSVESGEFYGIVALERDVCR